MPKVNSVHMVDPRLRLLLFKEWHCDFGACLNTAERFGANLKENIQGLHNRANLVNP